MTRTPDCKLPEVKPVPRAGYATQVREYELITPLYGGGATAQAADAVTVVRVPSIRGQLRFWWRACCGASATGSIDGSIDDLRSREEAIWGMARSEGPTSSKVSLRLEVSDRGSERGADAFAGAAYAAFPLRESGNRLVSGVKFILKITYPTQYAADVAAALWAWETFGGLGARTRRGFGALRCVRVDKKDVPLPAGRREAEEAIRQGLADHVADGTWHPNLPHLSKDMTFYRVTPQQTSALEAWYSLLDKLKKFRQTRISSTPASPGRSQWSEPDEIRRLTHMSAPAHSTPVVSVRKFPRAHFGLPIIFHFRRDAHRRGDPDDTTLQGSGTIDRLASPLILRPLLCTDKHACGLAAVLIAPRVPPGGLTLKPRRGGSWPVQADVTVAEAGHIKPLHGQTDVLQAFLSTL